MSMTNKLTRWVILALRWNYGAHAHVFYARRAKPQRFSPAVHFPRVCDQTPSPQLLCPHVFCCFIRAIIPHRRNNPPFCSNFGFHGRPEDGDRRPFASSATIQPIQDGGLGQPSRRRVACAGIALVLVGAATPRREHVEHEGCTEVPSVGWVLMLGVLFFSGGCCFRFVLAGV